MPRRKNLVGQKFNHLTVIKLDEEKTKVSKRTYWVTECDCPWHTRQSVLASNLTRGNSSKCKYCKAENLLGKKYNRLTVIDRVIDKNDHVMWKCLCECGNEVVIRPDSLTSGHTKSCGCLQKEAVSQSSKINLIGQRFGRLTVIEESPRRQTDGGFYWCCNCDCGTKRHEVSGHHLKLGNIQSCGCMRSRGEEKIAQILSANNIYFQREYTIQDLLLSTGGHPRFDFAVFDENKQLQYFIEYHGEQHYLARGTIFTEEKVATIQTRDSEKEDYCKKNNIPLIIIPYTKFEKLCLEDLLIK